MTVQTMSFTATTSAKFKLIHLAWLYVFPVNGDNTVSVLSHVGVVEGDTMHDLMGDCSWHGTSTVWCEGDLSISATSTVSVPGGVT